VSARFQKDADLKGLWFEVSYDDRWVSIFLRGVPPKHRGLDLKQRRWWVSSSYAKDILKTCKVLFGGVFFVRVPSKKGSPSRIAADAEYRNLSEVLRVEWESYRRRASGKTSGKSRKASSGKRKKAPRKQPKGHSLAAEYCLLGLNPGDSWDAIKVRHRKLALEHHPDRGGDTLKMQEINAALDKIRTHLGRP